MFLTHLFACFTSTILWIVLLDTNIAFRISLTSGIIGGGELGNCICESFFNLQEIILSKNQQKPQPQQV